ncbi:S-layer homology domain-containing protein [Paenibacillus sp.]|uniref:S-layer homology domain-containing protein n=1 Tax=Paenibacillus sp. TaxID=58172 RepID=UPI0037C80E70
MNPAAFAAEITNVQTVASFKDVTGHWAQSPIGKWASSRIINGYTELALTMYQAENGMNLMC